MITVLITGASRGIGLELARQYAERGLSDTGTTKEQPVHVIATCRNPQSATSLNQLQQSLQAQGKTNLEIRQLDVADEQAVKAFAASLVSKNVSRTPTQKFSRTPTQADGETSTEFNRTPTHEFNRTPTQEFDRTPIDILINNAGMYGENAPLLPVNVALWHEVFHLNTIAPILLTQQLTENLKLSQLKKVVTISSDMGSIGGNTGGGAYLYRSSKSALNSAMYSLSLDFKPFSITVMMLHPGHVQTDMGGPNAKVPAQESAAGLRQVIDAVNIEQSGAFRNWKGEQMVW